MHDTWFITGIGRGLGYELAAALLAGGATVVGTTRSGRGPAELERAGLRVLPLDVTDPVAVARTMQEAITATGGLDVVVNNAGYGLLGPVETTAEAETEAVLATNFLGPLRVCQAAATHFRERGRGHIVNVSSIAGLAPLAGSGVYAAAKAAVSALSEALTHELEPFGIGVTSVEPGSLRTDFFGPSSIRLTAEQPEAYAETVGRIVGMMTARSGAEMGDPAAVARLIVEAVRGAHPPRHLVAGSDAMERARQNARALLADIATWEERSAATAFSPTNEVPAVRPC